MQYSNLFSLNNSLIDRLIDLQQGHTTTTQTALECLDLICKKLYSLEERISKLESKLYEID